MIVCKLYGGIGNQLFQMAASIGYSVKHNVPYYIPSKTEDDTKWKRHLSHLDTWDSPDKFLSFKTIKENNDQSFTDIPFQEGVNICLDGYWQSSKYFDHCIPKVLSAFNFTYKKNSGVVAIHIRRGDYLQLPDHHPAVTKAHVYMAVRYFYDLGYRDFKFFSDDIKWCMDSGIRQAHPKCTFSFSVSNSVVQDLEGISCCEHLIGSNSSFSLWGYLLNQNEKKMCVFPKTWYGPALSHLDQNAMYPENAIIL